MAPAGGFGCSGTAGSTEATGGAEPVGRPRPAAPSPKGPFGGIRVQRKPAASTRCGRRASSARRSRAALAGRRTEEVTREPRRYPVARVARGRPAGKGQAADPRAQEAVGEVRDGVGLADEQVLAEPIVDHPFVNLVAAGGSHPEARRDERHPEDLHLAANALGWVWDDVEPGEADVEDRGEACGQGDVDGVVVPPVMAEEVQGVPPALEEHRQAEEPVDRARDVECSNQEDEESRDQQADERVPVALQREYDRAHTE